jgi:error-prone DNA polymerase
VLRGAINERTLQRIHEAARQRPFASVTDLCTRMELAPGDIEQLIAAGALDPLAPNRRHARWEARFAHGRSLDQTSLLDARTWPEPPLLEGESPYERGAEEYATLGFTLSVDHPLALVDEKLARHYLVCAERLRMHIGQRVQVAGVIVAGRKIRTSAGRMMTFASLCDRTGVLELTLFEGVAARYTEVVQEGGLVVATGIVTDHTEHGTGVEVRQVRRIAALIASEPVVEMDPLIMAP